MKGYSVILTAVVVIAGLAGASFGKAFAQTARAETAYERVLRTGVLRCGYVVYDPYLTKDPNTGQIGGFTAELVEALGRTLNLKVEWTLDYAIGTQIEALKSGKIDALCLDGPWTRSAMPYLTYTHALYYLPAYAWLAAGSRLQNQPFSRLNSSDVTVAVMDGDGSQDMALALLPEARMLSIPNTADPALTLENVATGKADVALTDPVMVEYYNAGHSNRLVPLLPQNVVATYPVLMTALPQDRELVDMLNRALDYLRDTGLLERILRKPDPTGLKVLAPVRPFQTPPQ